MSDTYAIRIRRPGEGDLVEPVAPSDFGIAPAHRADVEFRNAVYPLRKAKATATVEMLRDGEVVRVEEVTPYDKFIEITNSRPGHAHTQVWGSFSGPVTDTDIRNEVYSEHFGGRDLRIDWLAKTFYGIRHTD